jgi:beta-galactosidase
MDYKSFTHKQYKDKPIVLCEYAHAMGNGLGNFAEYTAYFNNYANFIGGFIWDFVDQALYHKTAQGETQWLYGGDFGEEVSHRYFCANGIVFADRSLHPAIYEVKKCYEQIKITAFDLHKGIFLIKNNYSFYDLSDCRLRWELLEDGVSVKSGSLETLKIIPQAEYKAIIDYRKYDFDRHKEYVLGLFIEKSEDCALSTARHVLACEQFSVQLQFSPPPQQKEKNLKTHITLIEDKKTMSIEGKDFLIKFNKLNGYLSGIDYGKESLKNTIQPNLWRAYTDNDLGFSNFLPGFSFALQDKSWEKATKSARLSDLLIKSQGAYVTINACYKISNTKDGLTIQYEVDSEGKIFVTASIYPTKDMVRFGLQFTLDSALNNLVWYGRGPHENYCDRKSGALLGIHQSSLTDFSHDYLRPQENANRCDVRRLNIIDQQGNGLMIKDQSGAQLNISAWAYSQEDLNKVTHIHNLPVRDFVTLNIDMLQCGVGGSLPGRLMLLDKYKILKNKFYCYSFTIEKIIGGK